MNLFPAKLLSAFINGPRREYSFTQVDLNDFLKQSETEFKAFLGPNINLRYSLSIQLPPFLADKAQLKQLMFIFLSNAKKAMPQGGQLLLHTRETVIPDVDTFPQKSTSTSYALLTISDSGRGIPSTTQDRIEQLFSGNWQPRMGQLRGLTQAKEILDKMATDYKGSPWAIVAKRDRGLALGLAWQPYSTDSSGLNFIPLTDSLQISLRVPSVPMRTTEGAFMSQK